MAIPNEILGSINNIRPMSQSASRLMNIVADPEYDCQDIIDVVAMDAVLTAKLLRMVNSVAFGLRVPIDTVARAVPYLGERMIVGVSLGLCASHLYSRPLTGYESEEGALWTHCLRAAIAAREIARYAKDKTILDVAYTGGVMHDIGKSVISIYLEGSPRKIVQGADSGKFTDYLEGERQILGTDHCEVGAAVAAHWRLPASLTAVVRHHHQPSCSPPEHRALTYAVHLGDFVAMMGGTGTGADTLMYRIDENYKDYISISAKELELVVFNTGQEYEKIVSSMFDGQKTAL